MGWVAGVATLGWWGYCVASGALPTWRLAIFFPAAFAALAFLQSALHFCVKFGWSGVFNFGSNVGRTDTVEQAEYRRQDRLKAVQIVALAVAMGLAVAAISFFVP